MKRIALFGATGSIGRSALSVIQAHPEELQAVSLGANRNFDALLSAARSCGAKRLLLADEAASGKHPGLTLRCGAPAFEEEADCGDYDILLCAIVGMGGLAPVLSALKRGKTVALASKEVLVSAGDLVMRAAKRYGASILPVDSEHSALFQCLEHRDRKTVKKLILTASGGAFRDLTLPELSQVTAKEALAHPVWSMGPKVTIDSASMMNKALEMVEAHHLFQCGNGKLSVLIHRQSLIHSLILFRDGCELALISTPDMRLPIQYALSWPDRWSAPVAHLNLAKARHMDFAEPNAIQKIALSFAREVIRQGGTSGAAMNAANEVAVEYFTKGWIRFPDIWRIVEETLSCVPNRPQDCLETVLAADAEARQVARKQAEMRKI